MDGLSGHIIRRLMFLPITLLIVSFATFYISRWGPGDAVSIYSGQFRDEDAFERVREQYGLDKPIYQQYGIWLEDVVLHGDFGPSYRYRDRDIPDVIFPKMWVSMRVAAYAFVLTFLIGIPIGVFAAVKRGTWMDPVLISTFLFLQSIPVLVFVPLLVLLLSVKLDLVPPGAQKRVAQIRAVGQGIELLRASLQHDRLVVALEAGTQASVQVVDVRISRREFERTLETRLGAGPVQVDDQQRERLCTVSVTELGVERDRPRRGGQRRSPGLVARHRAVVDHLGVGQRESGMRERERGIACDGELEVVDAPKRLLGRARPPSRPARSSAT